jgi:hypothetical protein
MASFFRNRTATNRQSDAACNLMIAARAILGAHGDPVVSISQHDCGAAGCGGIQTVVLVMRADQPTKAIKINKPVDTVTQADLSAALAPLVGGPDRAASGRQAD